MKILKLKKNFISLINEVPLSPPSTVPVCNAVGVSVHANGTGSAPKAAKVASITSFFGTRILPFVDIPMEPAIGHVVAAGDAKTHGCVAT